MTRGHETPTSGSAGASPDDQQSPSGAVEPSGPIGGDLRADLRAGLVVFLVAVPLCLGIAHASGAPPVAGLLTGILGGLVVGRLSGSHTSVSGPAAGLTVVVLDGITELGLPAFFLAVSIAGGLQILLGLVRAGTLADYFPSSVVRGMLAGIGVLIILSQFPHMLGLTAVADDLGPSSLHLLGRVEPFPLVIGLVSLVILVAAQVWQPFIAVLRRFSFLSPPLLVVLVTVAMAGGAALVDPAWALSPQLRVQVPNVWAEGGLSSLVRFPDFTVWSSPAVWKVAFVIAAVASIETLLCIGAVDRLDLEGRKTPANRELLAQGTGNALAGLLGGIPMTAVVIRGSANVQAGATTRRSAIFHGALLVTTLLLLPDALSLIPLAALAAVLVQIGYSLASPVKAMSLLRESPLDAAPFLTTVICIVTIDLLSGVVLGLVVSLFIRLIVSKASLVPGRRSTDEPVSEG